jgi:hypothetical protein
MQFTQDIEDASAEGLAGLVELFEEAPVNVALARFLGHKVPEVAHLGLADAMNAPKALLNAIRVPGQIVIDHQMRALKVDAFARRIGRRQDAHLGIVLKALFGLLALFAPQAAMNIDFGTLRSDIDMRIERAA